MRTARLCLLLAALAALAACGGCSTLHSLQARIKSPQPLRPWVKPYEREHLADRIMQWDRDPLATAYITHVHENREGARGATGAAGGGCGCN